MSLVHWFLDLAGLLMWLSWRGIGDREPVGEAGTLLGNVRPAGTRGGRHWGYLAGLAVLLVFRALFYRQVGPAIGWHGSWSTGVVLLSFRSDFTGRMLAFSLVSFVWMLFAYHASLLLLAALNRPPYDRDAVTRQVRRQLGWAGTWPVPVQLALPSVVLFLAWLGGGWLAARAGLLPEHRSGAHLVEQALLIGLGAVLVWRWVLTLVLVLHQVNLYVYFGATPFMDFIQATGASLVRPFAWARLGRVDVAPTVALLLVWLVTAILGSGFGWLGQEFAGLPEWVKSGVLPALYRTLPW